ncbi:1,2-phenylacetyl-CoA epoxidase subunit PaaD [Brumimicrobium aurantiacum]|uniref:Phenylacetate-CoA oxygenase subunit PaaJ n=1 Tax=Brumimicrobium aurantiacum TaxID=1737063 RepID=A0A3E1EVT5_9FLAO|nr:1,2-phenylacetyl-CoA epoxidase subunit PaaD [Brumimicrobium aurantiacum]RFC53674.1 phenylacetate-CoA oxygenase subunit PaaJ [Brumimicrobium aurantiacum]
MTKEITIDDIWEMLEDVTDPEVPVLTVVDLGVVREVIAKSPSHFKIVITPTYTGCPAMQVIEEDIKERLGKEGITVDVDLVLSPAWTTDWLSENGRKKLEEYGITPPQNEGDKSVLFGDKPEIPCPLCKSKNTRLVSQFGSTACKALYQCNDCEEPFDYFKCLK